MNGQYKFAMPFLIDWLSDDLDLAVRGGSPALTNDEVVPNLFKKKTNYQFS